MNELIASCESTKATGRKKKTTKKPQQYFSFFFFLLLFLFTFDCSLEEDLAAATGEDAVVAARSLVGAHQAGLGPALPLSRGRSLDRFLPGGSAAGAGMGGGGQEGEVSRLFSFSGKVSCGILDPELFF